jgi:hypothetical protein
LPPPPGPIPGYLPSASRKSKSTQTSLSGETDEFAKIYLAVGDCICLTCNFGEQYPYPFSRNDTFCDLSRWSHAAAATAPDRAGRGHATAAAAPDRAGRGHAAAATAPDRARWGHATAATAPARARWGHATAATAPGRARWGHSDKAELNRGDVMSLLRGPRRMAKKSVRGRCTRREKLLYSRLAPLC